MDPKNAKNFKLTSRPWWLSHAVSTPRGIVVARAHGESLTNRLATEADIAEGIARSKYHVGPDRTGEPAKYLVDLTEADLVEMRLTPGELKGGMNVVDGWRPSANDSDRPVSQADAQRAIDWLQNEGHEEPEFVDRTPWQKGDDSPA